ncbi:xanthine dehydrogenase family protein molybdopterin-binding subunit [Sphingomonas sp.]|jgi:isoquinoline 1-oxidoreductase beta subunit|uniref:xanthine dehydrogenase family protein molybdopterin-binding subunit n=1 Tax=Sphingomonas sp. TaxID=28214 RepID=UPI002DEF3A50|nr:molybdopterin cofactor-binding domain-containing protein [Sphingomonas sp.]HEV2568964.1 molybdopterin cofactor-binding domain-containing protein [Sphingomonas sp.]
MRASDAPGPSITRRRLLVTGGLGVGLVVVWSLWPRDYPVNLVAGRGEHINGPYLKIAEDGRVIVAVPQVETGQGAFTTLPQIIADELGADWRTVAVEAAPINPLYANRLFLQELSQGVAPSFASFADTLATRSAAMVTAGSTTVRMYEQPMREAAAAARVRLCKVAARRWEVDWQECEAEGGFVVHSGKRLRFADLAADAVEEDAPEPLPLRMGKLTGQSLPRLDTPAKLDGSVDFAADVRLPNMVYAAMRQGPVGVHRYVGGDVKAAERVRGVLQLVSTREWVAAVATTSWAAERALDALRPRFETRDPLLDDASIAKALRDALDGDGFRIVDRGDLAASFRDATVITAEYQVEAAAHAALEPVTATASWSDGALSLWLSTIAPEAARQVVARSLDLDPSKIVIHPMQVGGGFGRGMSSEAAVQAGHLSRELKRPVQLFWSRAEAILQGRFRPPARAQMTGRVSGGRVAGLLAKVAAPAYGAAVARTLLPNEAVARSLIGEADGFAVAGAETPYGIANLAVDHHLADPKLPIGYWRSAAHSYTCFFTESFVDELARAAGTEPFSFRMAMLGQQPRLARCLSTVAALGGWQGGEAGTGQGIAVHAAHGSFIAVLVEARTESGRVRCDRLVAVADVGRMIHPDIVRQQMEGGLIFGLAAAIGCAPGFESGLTRARRLADLNLPRLADTPEISVELLPSNEEPGGASELAVPPVGPALANALFAATGRRFRRLPIRSNA